MIELGDIIFDTEDFLQSGMLFEFLDDLLFYLSDSFSCDIKFFSDLFQCIFRSIYTISHLHDLRFSIIKHSQDHIEIISERIFFCELIRPERIGIFEQVCQSISSFISDFSIKRHISEDHFFQFFDFFDRKSKLLTYLFRGWLSSKLLEEHLICFVVAIDFIDKMHRYPYVFGHIGDSLGDGLFDPSSSIGGKFEFFIRIEFFNRLDKSYISLLDQIRKAQSRTEKSLRNTDDESEIGFDEDPFCGLITFLYTFCDVSFFFRIQ